MARLNIMMDDDLAKKLRLRSVELYDGEKGALSHAISDAVERWLEKSPTKKK
jgi:post-segregation antitoxin (ccd killing protein)